MKSRPRLLNGDVPYYNAFQYCNASRPASMGGMCAIPISEINAFCQLVGIVTREERVKYLELIQELDNLCLEHWAKEAKQS
jgi:hypothetical protein